MFELIDSYGIHYSNDILSSGDGYDKKEVANSMNTKNCLIPVWYLMNMLMFSNKKSIIGYVVGQN